jgi:16S rRNA (cytosine967-C5)-methyltransferase
MAERMEGEGRILAFDLYEHRVKLIEKEASRLGIDIIEAKAGDSSVYCKELDSTADYVIADVPCSGLGTLREHPEIKYRPLSRIEVQGKILENALRYVKPGGYVLYSTCTVNPEENEEVVKSCSLINSFALGSSYEEGRDYRVIGARQLITKAGGHDGFFICLIQRRSN